MAISSPGIGSNLDVNSIVTQLMELEQRPLLILTSRESVYTAQLSSMGSIQGALSTFQSSVGALKSAGTNTSYRATSSDTDAVTAAATPASAPGVYQVNVTALSQAQQLVAAGQATSTGAIGSGAETTLTFSFGSITGGTLDDELGTYTGATFTPDTEQAQATVTISAGNNSLAGIRDAINAADIGVTAAIVNDGSGTPYRLTLAVDAPGDNHSLKIDVAGDAALSSLLSHDPEGTQNLSQTRAAQNAALTVNGIAITSQSNTVAGAIPGTALTLKSVAENVAITITRDDSAIQKSLEGLVKGYNDLNAAIGDATAYKAIMQGDGSMLGIQNRIRSAIGAIEGTTGTIDTLSQLGVRFQVDGTLQFSTSALTDAMNSDPEGVREALAIFGDALKTLADDFNGPNGVVKSRVDGVNRSIDDIARQRESFQLRLTKVEERYRAQFAALDALLGTMQSTSNYLTQQLANLPTIGGNNN
ncbi:MAG: flagellar filament capping protein FliD [Gammaproteobacteria bacterium]|nr:flagellar filament capping protein FliD [Gammaproteobacteria bacterium]